MDGAAGCPALWVGLRSYARAGGVARERCRAVRSPAVGLRRGPARDPPYPAAVPIAGSFTDPVHEDPGIERYLDIRDREGNHVPG